MGLYTLYIQKDSLLEGIFVSEILFVGLKLDSSYIGRAYFQRSLLSEFYSIVKGDELEYT